MPSLQDHMAEVLLRAIIRFPDRCPPELARAASEYQRIKVKWEDLFEQNGRTGKDGVKYIYADTDSPLWNDVNTTWKIYEDSREEFQKLAGETPAILADYEP